MVVETVVRRDMVGSIGKRRVIDGEKKDQNQSNEKGCTKEKFRRSSDEFGAVNFSEIIVVSL